jgi:hypothetical protein
MGDLRSELRKLISANKPRLSLPAYFNFKQHAAFDFDPALSFFDWTLKNESVQIDISTCKSANYQTLSLLILYAWRLKSNGCRVEFKLSSPKDENGGASEVWRMMGAPGLFSVSFNETQNFFSHDFKPLLAIRDHRDFKAAIERANEFSAGFDIEHINTLRYVISELLYNTLEHGVAYFEDKDSWNRRIPSLIQFTWYAKRDEVQFIVGDVGIGVKKHLSRSYPGLEDDEEALALALQPKTSGTFSTADPYTAKNNAGMGLYLSSNIIRRLHADMYVVSNSGVIHVSPTDTTTRVLKHPWPGTFALVNLRLDQANRINLQKMMGEFRQAADRELAAKTKAEDEGTFYLHIQNFFGTNPEDKSAAISYRDKYLLPAIADGKKLLLDFDGVSSSPHSFLNALLATPIKRLGMSAYKRLKVINAQPDIRETIDFVLDDNTTGDEPGI